MTGVIHAVAEYNDHGWLIYADNYPGAYVRGASCEQALVKFPDELRQYLCWRGDDVPAFFTTELLTQHHSPLEVQDADSDILFDSERLPLTTAEYNAQKELALRSAADFLTLYQSIPDRTHTVLEARNTFYGARPRTADEMYFHTKDVNAYYFGELGVDAPNEPDILRCRQLGFAALEQTPFLENPVQTGSYDEEWSVRKLLRRFLWHDRIHARAMYRMACRLCGAAHIANPFCFDPVE